MTAKDLKIGDIFLFVRNGVKFEFLGWCPIENMPLACKCDDFTQFYFSENKRVILPFSARRTVDEVKVVLKKHLSDYTIKDVSDKLTGYTFTICKKADFSVKEVDHVYIGSYTPDFNARFNSAIGQWDGLLLISLDVEDCEIERLINKHESKIIQDK